MRDLATVAEVYTFDAVSQLGYLAAVTERVELMSGIFPVYSRTPALTAMTAAGLDFLAENGVALGPGVRVLVRYDAATGRIALAAAPDGPFPLRRLPGAGAGFALAATALARLVGGPAVYTFSLAPDGALVLTPAGCPEGA